MPINLRADRVKAAAHAGSSAARAFYDADEHRITIAIAARSQPQTEGPV
jgi:hypothetical protein